MVRSDGEAQFRAPEPVGNERLQMAARNPLRLLAAALGLGPDAISFYCCRNVLRRWTMTCMHGVIESIDEPMDSTGQWKDEAAMNPVLAILLKNA